MPLFLRFFRLVLLMVLTTASASFLMIPPVLAQPKAFTTITGVNASTLSNGVRIVVRADGILQYRNADENGRTMSLYFPDARNGTGKNVIQLDSYPVSYIQLSTPQGAQAGLGVQMQIFNLADTRANFSATPDGQGVIIVVQSDRTLASGGANATSNANAANAGAATSDTSLRLSVEDGLLFVRAVGADVHQLMAAIAREAGLAIAVDDDVTRKITLNLDGTPPRQAIETIAAAYGLALSSRGGVLVLTQGVPNDLATYRASQTASFRIQNSRAGTVSALLPNFLYSYVKVNNEQNAVVVTAPTTMLAKIGADLQKVDVPSPQIALEAVAVELSDSSDLDIGLRLGSPNANSFSSVDVGSGLLTYNTIGTLPRTFEANLRALELKGRARVRARPRMVVVNGERADLFIGSQRFILTQFNQSGQTQNRIQPVDVGVKLLVTPLTGGNGEITVRVAPEVSNITELDLATGLPVLSTRRSDTTVRVRDGETIAIGGLTLDQEQIRRGKIPLLGDLPLIGGLFRSRKKTTVKNELVVFVTPRILGADGTPLETSVNANNSANADAKNGADKSRDYSADTVEIPPARKQQSVINGAEPTAPRTAPLNVPDGPNAR